MAVIHWDLFIRKMHVVENLIFLPGQEKKSHPAYRRMAPYLFQKAKDYPTASLCILLLLFFLSSSFNTTLRIRIFLGVTSIHSSC